MSVWELRQTMESAVPWWIPFAVVAVLLTAFLVMAAREKR